MFLGGPMRDADGSPVLNLLGAFTLAVDGRSIPMVYSVQRLLAVLALQARPLSRSYVAGLLWPETTSEKAAANLRSALWRAHKIPRNVIEASAHLITLSGDLAVDLRDADAGARRLLDLSRSCDDLLVPSTRAILSADLLPEWWDDWLTIEQERFHQLRLHALEALCERFTRLGRYGEAVDAGLGVVCSEPYRESAHYAIVRAHLAAGNRWEAIRQYERCRELLRTELGLDPSVSFRNLLVGTRRSRRPVDPGSGVVYELAAGSSG